MNAGATIASSGAIAAAIAVAAEQKQILDTLKDAGALRPADAVALPGGKKSHARTVKALHKAGFIGRTAGGHYYLTPKGLERQQAKPPSTGKVLLVIGGVLMVALGIIGLALVID
ncbi:hypothetical protein [Sphingomicrobium astaxanthinifaciens]|uniref:hypothetical protein n=1 Tax=Sphingomicrobium astaxanthinifaciens TaxID=1227949 RepID=UPI001FCBCB7E|nr:hypothetical protein [Sphingomicrobium astaxanthinifaciens]MCJ7421569.1 hypothetical protein [Sphingomicrobium astaxanthinifaciens]